VNVNERIDEALRRITLGMGPMRLPADPCDADIVLADAKSEITRLAARVKELEGIMREHDRKLLAVWGTEEDPYAVAYGWVKIDWDAVLAAKEET
jgi:hypothetical protein